MSKKKETYDCEWCDKVYTTKKGLNYHLKKYHLEEQESAANPPPAFESIQPENVSMSEEPKDYEPIIETTSEEGEVSEPEWMKSDFSFDEEDDITDPIPHTYKNMASSLASGGKMNAKIAKDVNIGLLMPLYGLVDIGLSKWATWALEEETEIRHSHRDKLWTSEATYLWMQDAGIDLSTKMTPAMLALAANGMYVGLPTTRIMRKSKKQGLLKKLATAKKFGWIGKLKFWGRKKKPKMIPDEEEVDY